MVNPIAASISGAIALGVEFDDDLDEQFVKNETINQPNSITSDWDDETYSAW